MYSQRICQQPNETSPSSFSKSEEKNEKKKKRQEQKKTKKQKTTSKSKGNKKRKKKKGKESKTGRTGKWGQRWTTLSHNGVNFPPPYVPHGVKMLYDGSNSLSDNNTHTHHFHNFVSSSHTLSFLFVVYCDLF
jgi:hypothetical protein